MKNQVVLFVFAALFSAAMAIADKAAWGFNCTATISNNEWQCGSDFALPTLAAALVVNIPHNSSEVAEYGLQICLQNKLGLAHPSRWNADTCTYYQTIAPTVTVPVSAPVEAPKAEAPVEAPKAAPVAAPVEAPKAEPTAAPVEPPKPAFVFSAVNAHGYLPSGQYVVGIAFVKPPTGNYSHALPFTLTSTVCVGKEGDFECENNPIAAAFPSNTTFNLANAGAKDFFSASVNNVLYGSVTIKTNPLVSLHLRRNGYPFTNPAEFSYNDANSDNGVLILNNPVHGDYLMAGLLTTATNTTEFPLDSTVKVCNASANVAGPDCSISVVALTSATGQLYDGTASSSMSYYKLNVDLFNKTSLSFSVASKTSAPSPRVYVRWGNLPDENNYDYVGCSTEYCAVNQVDLPVLSGSAGDWYIGVIAAANTNESYAFGIWHGAVCPNNCGGDHGTCNTSGEKMGTCTCAEGFTAIDCSSAASSGLSPEMIVLIVMGGLVVLSAVIGFIAWAYMRRKRGYDEIQ